MNRKTITLSALWTRRLTALLAVAGLNLCLAPGVMAAGDFRVADIELRRTSDETWLATWSFSEPVEAVRVYPPELGFRKRSWVLETEGLQIEETGEGAVIRHVDGPMHGFSIAFSTDSEFEDKTYVPVLPFSDGGAAVYT
ncbi:MAG: hypothetical protein R3348_04605, partial [Xanthomonadales bacterium]|nr:hypothetical protein [Xanthomonadales bacterium]